MRPVHYRATSWDSAGRAISWTAKEKGIDVLLAIDMVLGAVQDRYDVAVLVSADLDLIPALEAVVDRGKWVEVASWKPEKGWGSRLRLRKRSIWCHWLDRGDFDQVHDDTDYAKPAVRRGP
jgi:uncharacterized LabA/DUF88 family protein